MSDDSAHTEYTEVEKPLIDQLLAQESHLWDYLQGDKESISGQGRENWREVILKKRLLTALKRINVNDSGKSWLDDVRLNQACRDLDRLTAAQGHSLMEKNQTATALLLEGTVVEGVADWNAGRNQRIQYIDWHNPKNNEFLIINRFRVDEPDGQHKNFIVPDIVLFVNGIPLVVIECKNPVVTNPIEEGINQLLRYSNQRHWLDAREGNEKLFYYAQLLIVTDYDDARMACPGAQFEHYLAWKDCYPTLISDLAASFGKTLPSKQQLLVEGVLRPERLLDILRNFVIFMQVDGRTVKIAPRYQQYRTVVKAMQRLETQKTRQQDGEFDRRGGVVFHTQGSGKSLTMVFLIRRMSNHVDLRHFKIVFVNDRTYLHTEFAPVFSAKHNDDPAYAEWSDKSKIEQRIKRFKKPFTHKDPEKSDPLAFLIVKNMLLVGFDAPGEQVLYIDRRLKEDELLQAIARVNRTRSGKNVGYVVDYVGIGGYLAEALSAYAKDDITGAFRSAKQELLDLRDRRARVINLFKKLGVANIEDTEACVEALRPEWERANFIVAYKQFLKTYGNLEHRPEVREYTNDAKTLGFIAIRARNRYRDAQLNISGVGDKVRAIIDQYIVSQGIDRLCRQ